MMKYIYLIAGAISLLVFAASESKIQDALIVGLYFLISADMTDIKDQIEKLNK